MFTPFFIIYLVLIVSQLAGDKSPLIKMLIKLLRGVASYDRNHFFMLHHHLNHPLFSLFVLL